MKQKLLYGLSALAVGLILMLSLTAVGRTAITELSGLAVAQSGSLWKNVKDASAGDNLVDGVLAAGMIFYDSASNNFDRLRGSINNGILVDVTRSPGSNQTPADGFANPTTFQGTWSLTGIFNGSTWDRWRGTVVPVQGPTLFNSQNVSAANTAQTITIAASSGTRAHLYRIARATCSPAGVASLQINDGATPIWGSNTGVPTFPAQFQETWPVGLTGTTNTAFNIVVGSCGSGNVSVVEIQADRF
jgi:hypothetical protein